MYGNEALPSGEGQGWGLYHNHAKLYFTWRKLNIFARLC